MKINEIRPLESKFTEVLEAIVVKPKMLYYYGKMQDESDFGASPEWGQNHSRPKTIAIVGTRKNTAYGYEAAYRLAYELAKRGAVIVSGLALGCDSIAHRGCLDAGGRTVAVLGTAIDDIYPKRHFGLAREIVEAGGTVMSEYAPGNYKHGQEARARFLERNRLIAGLADVVIVVEANERSGSLNTAGHAMAQGKELWAVPGDITRPLSRGCNKLIAQGANPVVSVEETVEAIFPTPKRKKARAAAAVAGAGTPAERAVLEALRRGVRDGDAMVAAGIVSAAEFNVAITMLEIRGVVKPLGMNCWAIV